MSNKISHLFNQAMSVQRVYGTKLTATKIYRFLGGKIIGDSFYQKPIIDCIKRYASRHRTFIDIGANIGTITTAVAPLFEYCLAIEPNPRIASHLRKSVDSQNITNCQVIECAIGDRAGTAVLYCSKDGSKWNSLTRHRNSEMGIEVRVATLDEIVKQTRVGEPFLIKVDVEGHEWFVLKGGRHTLGRACRIVTEFWPWGLKMAGCSPSAYIEWMKMHGFIAFNLDGRPVTSRTLSRLCRLGEDDAFVLADLLFQRMAH